MRVTEIQRFCMHDGPGIRTTVFLKGCPLRCVWCHNPEAQYPGQEILYYPVRCIGCGACADVCPAGAHKTDADGANIYDRSLCVKCGACASACPADALSAAMREMSPGEVFEEVMKDKAFYGDSGGVTLSGGEPMLHGEEALELLSMCKEAGITTAVETCGFFDPALIPAMRKYVDLLLWDYKDGDDARLKKYTGATDRRDIDNLLACDSAGIPSVLRCIMVSGVNTDQARLNGIVLLYRSLSNCRCAELLPYHTYGGSKQAALGRVPDTRNDWIPSGEELDYFASALKARGVNLKEVRK